VFQEIVTYGVTIDEGLDGMVEFIAPYAFKILDYR
jgi:hypothetical protein